MGMDLLGRPTTEVEDELRSCTTLQGPAGPRRPCPVRPPGPGGGHRAWNVVNDLGLEHEQLLDLGA